MYNETIKTTVDVRGHQLWIEYKVSPEYAISWWIVRSSTNLNDSCLELLETMLRLHESESIRNSLIDEFEDRMYALEAQLHARMEEQDVPF